MEFNDLSVKRSGMRYRACCVVCLLLTASSVAVCQDLPLERLEERAFKQAAALADPSIVQIQTVGGLDRIGNTAASTGPTTGVVLSADGYLISSAFNFADRPASILVLLPDGRRLPAEQIATDHLKMLTLLKVTAADLVPIQAASGETRVGQWSLALGKTFSTSGASVSIGVVSAVNRIWGNALQTDAKVSPVNYGGPLVDIHGRALGILVPLSPNRGSDTAGVEWYDSGIGFAIPMDDVLQSFERLKAGKDLEPGLIGVTFTSGNLLDEKPTIDRVRYGSPASDAGIKTGDVVVNVDGHAVLRYGEVKHAFGRKYADDIVAVTVKREGKQITAEMKMVAELEPFEAGFLGILPTRGRTSAAPETGVGVRFVFANSPAEKASLKPRDRIVQVGDNAVNTPRELWDQLSRVRPGEEVSIVWQREQERITKTIALASIPNELPEKLPPVVTPPREEAAEEKTETGHRQLKLPGEGGEYWAYIPEGYRPDQPLGLLVWIHPDGNTMEGSLQKAWKTICDTRGIAIVGPQAAEDRQWTLDDGLTVQRVVEHFRQQYAVDSQRVFLHGYGTGGKFALHLSNKFRDVFRGVSVVSGTLADRPADNEPNLHQQFYFVVGEKDQARAFVELSAALLGKMKYPVQLSVLPDVGDEYPGKEPLQEIGLWADMLDRL